MPIFKSGYTEKTSPNDDNDAFLIADSTDSNTVKYSKWGTMKNAIQTFIYGLTNWVTTAMLQNNSVTTAKIGDNQVTTAKIANSSVTPAKRSGGFKIGTIPAATLSSIGNKTITGVGFKPRYIEFDVIFDPTSASMRTGKGWMDEFGSQGFSATASNGPVISVASLPDSRCVGWINAGNTARSMGASYVSMNDDGFTINVNEANGAFPIVYKAFA